MSQYFRISELADEFDITTRTIRYYEEKGLLHPKRLGNQRIYSHRDRTTLKLILRGKRLGFSLEESREIIRMYAPDQDNIDQLETLIGRIAAKRQQLLQQQTDLTLMLDELNAAEQQCRQALARRD